MSAVLERLKRKAVDLITAAASLDDLANLDLQGQLFGTNNVVEFTDKAVYQRFQDSAVVAVNVLAASRAAA